jgi:hypothetical protein
MDAKQSSAVPVWGTDWSVQALLGPVRSLVVLSDRAEDVNDLARCYGLP